MTEIEQKLKEFSEFLFDEENRRKLVRVEYGDYLEDIYGQLSDIMDNQESLEEKAPIGWDDFMDNDDD
jgi:hypothetical protein